VKEKLAPGKGRFLQLKIIWGKWHSSILKKSANITLSNPLPQSFKILILNIYSLSFFEISAKTGYNVEELFVRIVKDIKIHRDYHIASRICAGAGDGQNLRLRFNKYKKTVIKKKCIIL